MISEQIVTHFTMAFITVDETAARVRVFYQRENLHINNLNCKSKPHTTSLNELPSDV